ncbi:MAG TPA: hypothetical protein VKE96_12175 [Vicinamibacterales bacterium]|nr:hypothetical protein [Vicinamibacterales bacterium]
MILTRTQRKAQRNERIARRRRDLRTFFLCVLCSFLCVLVGRASARAQQPQPFPRPGQPARPAQPAPTTTPAPAPPGAAAPPAAEATPTEATLGVPVFPGAQFIASYDAGRGQRYYIFGTAASFVELVAYYRTVLKQKGELVYEVPATHEFDVGRYREETMAFPPGVTIKDFQSEISQGYPNPKRGAKPERFPTIIQIVPVTEKPE